jgi:hypothetical protein
MATQVWRTNPGESQEQVTTAVGAATTKLIEVTVDLNATGVKGPPDRKIAASEVIAGLERVIQTIAQTGWPPA